MQSREYFDPKDGKKHICWKATSTVDYDSALTMIVMQNYPTPVVNFELPQDPVTGTLRAGRCDPVALFPLSRCE